MSLVPLGRRAPVTSTPVRRSGESIEPRELDAHRTTNPHDITSNSQICYISSHRPSPCSLDTRPAATHAPHRVFPLQDMITRFSAGFTHPCPSPPSRPFFVKIVAPSPRPLSVDCFHRPPDAMPPSRSLRPVFFFSILRTGRGGVGTAKMGIPSRPRTVVSLETMLAKYTLCSKDSFATATFELKRVTCLQGDISLVRKNINQC